MSSIIRLAEEFAIHAHGSIDQRRKYSGKPYIVHPKAVAEIVASVTDDVEMISAAWLHDVVEDTPVTLDEIISIFGRGIASLVDDLTNISKKSDGSRDFRVALDRKHSAQASPRAKTVKLADVIDNLTGIVEADPEFAKRYVRENELLITVLKQGDSVLHRKASRLIVDCKNLLDL